MDLISQLQRLNIHWNKEPFLVPPFQRDLFTKIWLDRQAHLMTYLIGPRRVGKSIIFKQLMNKLIGEDKILPNQILFYEFDPGDTSDKVWEVYDAFTKHIADSSLPTYLFFDEIQYLKDYEIALKSIYDNAPQAKIFLTGSLSLSYKKRMSESLAGRFFTYHLFPLNFQEYLSLFTSSMLKHYQDLKNPTLHPTTYRMHCETLTPHFRQFLRFGRYPELSSLNSLLHKQYLESLVSQSLTQDAFGYFNISKPLILQNIFEYLCQNSGGLISKNHLSGVLGASYDTISHYLDILELMGLVYPLYNTLDPLKRLNSSKKIYVSSSFSLLRSKLDENTSLGFAAESYVLERFLELGETTSFWRDRNKEIDFLLPQKHLGYEIKYQFAIPAPLKLKNYQITTLSLISNPAIFTI